MKNYSYINNDEFFKKVNVATANRITNVTYIVKVVS